MIPDFSVRLGGRDATEKIRPYLNKIQLRDQDGTELDTATVSLSHSPEIEIPSRGTEMEISLGYKNDRLWNVFKGIVNQTGINGPPDMLFLEARGLALSDDKRLQSSTTRSWNEKTLKAIADEIISASGFKARVHRQLADIEIKRLTQTLETDLELLQKLAEAYGGFLKSDGETVALLPDRSRESVTGKKLPTVRIAKDKDKTSVYGWTIEHRKFSGKIVAFYQDDGKTKAVIKGTGSPEKKLKQIYATEAEADKAASEALMKNQPKEVFSATLIGQDIAVGSPLKVDGFPNPISGEFWVREVEHSYGKTYTVCIEAER